MPEQVRINRRRDGRYAASLQINGRRAYLYARVRRRYARSSRRWIIGSACRAPSRRRAANVSDLLDAWLDVARPSLKPKTLVGYEDAAQRHIRPHHRSRPVEQAGADPRSAALCGLAAKGLSRIPAQVHAILHRACRLGVMWGWLAVNPCDRVLPPKYKAARKEIWTAEQTGLFLGGIAEHRFGPLFVFLALTGARR